jgi:hypothetical protein
MLDTRDNSVLKSLKELRKQEDERVMRERAEAEARKEAERKAKEEQEQKAKQDEERLRNEAAERIRREEEAKLAGEREERFRLEEAERKARIEAELKLQHEKLRIDAEAKVAALAATKGKHVHVGLIVGVVAVLLVVAGGVIYKIKSDHAREAAAIEARTKEERQLFLLQQQEAERRLSAQIAKLTKQLTAAKTEAEREALKSQIKQIDEARVKRVHAITSRSGADKNAKAAKETTPDSLMNKPLIREKRSVSSDPLEGLKL